jgi:hypothetical protein
MRNSFKVISAILLLLPGLLFAHAGGRDIRGTLVKIEKDSIVVKRVDGVRETVRLASTTTYRVGEEEGKWEDMRVGSRAVVHIAHDGKAIAVHLPARK